MAMRWHFSELLTTTGTKVKRNTQRPEIVTLATEPMGTASRLLLFEEGKGLIMEMVPFQIQLHLEGIIVKGLKRVASDRYLYQEWWFWPASEILKK